jgi:hypothetical protein
MAEWYEQLLDRQLRVNRDIWADLEEHGISDDSELRLGFLYAAPGESEARQLVEFLRAETDYEVDARSRRTGLRPRGAWFVIGTTQPAPVSLALVDEWVEWMIAAGAAEGPCAFDGWAAQLVGD